MPKTGGSLSYSRDRSEQFFIPGGDLDRVYCCLGILRGSLWRPGGAKEPERICLGHWGYLLFLDSLPGVVVFVLLMSEVSEAGYL
jgi:hypothetical protein